MDRAASTAVAAKGVKHSVMVTLGTGVGGGIVVDGKLYSGFNFFGGELGHMGLDLTERTDIRKQATNAAYCDEQGNWVDLSFDTVVSMNFWGMTPSFLDLIGRGFETFLAERGAELKSEYYIPGAVDDFMKAGLCDVRVYDTDARWYGVTYAEDKPQVKASIHKMIEDGQYPERLWD